MPDVDAAAARPVAVPHCVQKRAPGTSFALHAVQFALLSGVPHDGQKLPVDSVLQFGHFMRGEYGPRDGA
ncbi:MAG TPA: hypothetical protein VMN60_01645 [Longimicrobiales bacterium]|nr:hypothetical protein [Longimicrobiales bacterium]